MKLVDALTNLKEVEMAMGDRTDHEASARRAKARIAVYVAVKDTPLEEIEALRPEVRKRAAIESMQREFRKCLAKGSTETEATVEAFERFLVGLVPIYLDEED